MRNAVSLQSNTEYTQICAKLSNLRLVNSNLYMHLNSNFRESWLYTYKILLEGKKIFCSSFNSANKSLKATLFYVKCYSKFKNGLLKQKKIHLIANCLFQHEMI